MAMEKNSSVSEPSSFTIEICNRIIYYTDCGFFDWAMDKEPTEQRDQKEWQRIEDFACSMLSIALDYLLIII